MCIWDFVVRLLYMEKGRKTILFFPCVWFHADNPYNYQNSIAVIGDTSNCYLYLWLFINIFISIGMTSWKPAPVTLLFKILGISSDFISIYATSEKLAPVMALLKILEICVYFFNIKGTSWNRFITLYCIQFYNYRYIFIPVT